MAYQPTTSFSGPDCMIYFVFPNARPVYVGTLTTLTYSTFRDTRQVRTLGRIKAKGRTKGPRTVGGTLIYTVINQHVVNDIMDELKVVTHYKMYDKIKPDELPPFDIIISMGNEYGQSAKKVIYGVSIVDDGGSLSIEDVFSENQMTYIADDIEHMENTKGRFDTFVSSYSFRGNIESTGKFTIGKITSSVSYDGYIRQAKLMSSQYST